MLNLAFGFANRPSLSGDTVICILSPRLGVVCTDDATEGEVGKGVPSLRDQPGEWSGKMSC